MKYISVLLLAIVALFLVVAAVPLPSQGATLSDVPIFSPKRASLAVGADYAFYSGSGAPVFPVKKEWQGGIFAGYKLTTNLSLIAATRYGVDSKQFDSKLGLRLLVWSGTGQ